MNGLSDRWVDRTFAVRYGSPFIVFAAKNASPVTHSLKDPVVVSLSVEGQISIPESVQETFDIGTADEAFVYVGDERIVIEPVPSPDELHGIHAGEHERGTIIERVRELESDDN